MSRWRDVKHKKNVKKDIQDENSFDTFSASLSSRFKAFLTDSFLISTPIVYIVIYLIMGSGDDFAKDRLLGWSLILGSSLLIFVFFWYVKCQTPGMKAYSLKIVNLQKNRISFIQSVIRYIMTLIAICSIFLLLIPFFNKNRRTFQDIISNTFIINEE